MRVAIVTPTYHPYSSGISRMVEEEVGILEDAGFEVFVFTPAYTKISSTNKIKYIKPILKYGNAAFVPQLLWKLKGFDAVHLHYPFIGGAFVTLFWKKFINRQTPFFVTYHMDLKGKGVFKIIFYILTRIVTPLILNSASKVIVTTLDYAQSSGFFRTFFNYQQKFKLSKLVEIPPSVDTHKFQPNKKDDDLLKQFGFEKEDKIALFVGALDKAHYFKGVPALLTAFELLYKRYIIKNAKLLIVGSGNLRKFYEDLVKKSPDVRDKIVFAGRVPEKELPKYYNLCDFLVLPSTDSSEAFGIVILEAYASGKPVLASNLPGVRMVVNNEKTGLLAEPNNIDDLADKLRKMFEDAPLCEWGREARYLAETKYNRDIIGRKLVNLFKNINETI
jgi:glycosyltransferase involved in cell wall biosynthesis